MARERNEFHPDVPRRDILGKLLPTKHQRQLILKWFLFSLVCLAGLILQDVVMSRVSIFGATTDLVACFVLAICILQGAHSGCVFVLCASIIFYYSNSAPGPYCIPLLTGIAVFATLFRQAFLSQGFFTLLLCVGASLLLYELGTFSIGLMLGHTYGARIGVFVLRALLTLVAVPPVYPILVSIGKIGGEIWKE